MSTRKICFVDLETTGTYFWKHGVHQISGIIDIDGKVMEKFDFHVKPHPNAIIDEEALKASNVTKEQIMLYPSMKEVYDALIAILGKYVSKFDKKDKFFLGGYNVAAFDNNFLRAFFTQNDDNYFGSWFWPNTLDVYVLAGQKFIDERAEFIDFKLKTVCEYVGIQVNPERLHDAIYDIVLTRKLYYRCL